MMLGSLCSVVHLLHQAGLDRCEQYVDQRASDSLSELDSKISMVVVKQLIHAGMAGLHLGLREAAQKSMADGELGAV